MRNRPCVLRKEGVYDKKQNSVPADFMCCYVLACRLHYIRSQ